MDDYVTYCAVCGGPFGDWNFESMLRAKGTFEKEKFPEWISASPTILCLHETSEFVHNKINTTSDVQDEDLDIYQLDEIAGYSMNDPQADHFSPIHYACEHMVREFSSFATNCVGASGSCTADGTLIRSWADLYLALESQLEIDGHRRTSSDGVFRLEWENDSHGAAAFQHVVLGPIPANPHTGEPEHLAFFNKGWIRVPESQVFEADPEHLDLKEVTDFILSFLRRKPSTTDIEACPLGLETFRDYVNQRISRELQNTVIEYLHPLGEKVHLKPVGLLLSEDWRNLLPSATPWLWDLDLSKAFEEVAEDLEGAEEGQLPEWDWERLVRMLAQMDAFEPGGCMQGAPLGLRNRRRNRRMLVEMKAPRGGVEDGGGDYRGW